MSGVFPYGITRYPRSVWNEMQRDAAPAPNEIPKTYFCPECGHRHWIHSKIGMSHVVPKGSRETPTNSVEAARRHHAVHGDMDGKTCLLAECALHYPQGSSRKVVNDG